MNGLVATDVSVACGVNAWLQTPLSYGALTLYAPPTQPDIAVPFTPVTVTLGQVCYTGLIL